MDIIQAADNIISFTNGLSLEELSVDKLRYFAVVKNVEIICVARIIVANGIGRCSEVEGTD